MIYCDVQDIIVKSPLDNITPCWLYIHSFHVLRLLSPGLKAWYFSWWKERPMAWKTHGYQVDDISFGINSKLESGWLCTLQVYINPNSDDQSVHWWVWFRSCHLWTLILEVSQISDSFKPTGRTWWSYSSVSFCFTISVPPAAPRLDSGGPGECGGSRHRHGTARRGRRVASRRRESGQAMAQKIAQSVGESKNWWV